MTYDSIQLYFYVSLGLGLIAGLIVLIWWGKRIVRPTADALERYADKHGYYSTSLAVLQGLPRMLPAILVFALCCAPALYFNFLLKQHAYCLEVIRVNKIASPDHEFLKERCGRFDLKELLAQASRRN